MSLKRSLVYLLVVLSLLLVCACEAPEEQGARDNHIVLKGEDNMRDLGGFTGAYGKTVAYGKLFRSGELSKLKNADLNVIAALDLKHVIDLRTDQERKNKPDKLPEGPELHHLPLLSKIAGIFQFFTGQGMEQALNDYMISIYSTIDELKIASWTAIFDLLEKGETSLWHCTEGKDRAGMTTALVLLSLGVSKQDVMDDFMMSNLYLAESIEKTVNMIDGVLNEGTSEIFSPMLGVEEEYLQAFFDTIDNDYGGIDAFLELLDVDINAMRRNYLK